MTQPTFYFGYGSNLNFDDWRRHRPELADPATILEPVGTAWLPDFEPCFDYYSYSRGGGALDLRPRLGHRTAGVVFQVRGEGWQQLDRKEGAPACYERFDTVVLMADGSPLPVTTYRVVAARREPRFVAPTEAYVEAVRHGLQQYQLDAHALLAAAREESVPGLDALFVYGTLLRGEPRRPLLDAHGVRCTLLAETTGRLLDCGSYPGLVIEPDSNLQVQGELVRSDDIESLLRELDRVEGCLGFGHPDSLFERRLVVVHVGDGRTRDAWSYVARRAAGDGVPIVGGDWRAHLGRRSGFLEALVRSHCAGSTEEILARRIVGQHPFPPVRDVAAAAREEMPLLDALAEGRIAERALAMASGKWNVVPE